MQHKTCKQAYRLNKLMDLVHFDHNNAQKTHECSNKILEITCHCPWQLHFGSNTLPSVLITISVSIKPQEVRISMRRSFIEFLMRYWRCVTYTLAVTKQRTEKTLLEVNPDGGPKGLLVG